MDPGLRLRLCLHPLRLKLLEAVSRVPGSSLSLAKRLGDRQPRVHYHLRRLAEAGLVRVAEERRKRGVVERLYAAAPEAAALAAKALAGAALGESPRAALLGSLLMEASAPEHAEGFSAAESRLLRLTRGQAKQLQEDLLRLLRQYQAREGRSGGEYRVAWLLMPRSPELAPGTATR